MNGVDGGRFGAERLVASFADFAVHIGFEGFDLLLVEQAFAHEEERKFGQRIAMRFLFALFGGFVELFVVGKRMRIGANDVRVKQCGAAALANVVDGFFGCGVAFERVGAVEPVLAANLRWLSDYKHPRTLDPGCASALTTAFSQPTPLMEAAGSVGDPIAVLPSAFHMLWSGQLQADLAGGPLGGSTLVAAASESR